MMSISSALSAWFRRGHVRSALKNARWPVLLRRSDLLGERIVLKRRMNRWRLVAIFSLAFLILYSFGKYQTIIGEHYIARVSIYGFMSSSIERQDMLAKLSDDDNVKAVIVYIDSPGGSFVGGESVYRTLRYIAETKPVAAVFGDIGTSAAYMAALGADRIFAQDGTITASVGVVMQTADIVDLLNSVGIRSEVYKSGALKASPNPFEHTSDEVRRSIQTMIDDSFALFLDMVQQRRELPKDRLAMIKDGRVMMGRTAYENGLVDEIGSQREAVTWIESQPGIEKHLPVMEYSLDPENSTILLDSFHSSLNMVLSFFREKMIASRSISSGRGLVSIWEPR